MFARFVASCLFLGGCSSAESLAWSVETEPGMDHGAIRLVTAEVRKGGCDGSVIYTDTARPDEGMPSPTALPPGRYGFALAVANEVCAVIARGCAERELPASSVTTVLSEVTPEPLCTAERCSMGACVGAADAQAESGSPDGDIPDGDIPDGNVPDGGVPDGSVPDGAIPKAPGCSAGADPWTAMLFGFEDLPAMTTLDNTGSFTASFFSENMMTVPRTATDTASAQGCGKGFLGNETWGNVAHAPVFETRESSIDLLYKTPTSYIPTRMLAILSKDANGFGQTHLSLGASPDGRIMVRMQPGDVEFYRCSKPIETQTWVHIGINFGEPNFELWVNGELANEAGTYAFFNSSEPDTCNTDVQAIDIVDNTEPWAIGGATFLSTAGTNDMVRFEHDLGAVIDRVRFSTTRRDFSDPPLPPQ